MTNEEIEQLAEQYTQDGIYLSDSEKQQTEIAYMIGYKQCQEDMADKDKWTFEEILDACYPTLGRGSDWAKIAIRLKEQKLNKQD